MTKDIVIHRAVHPQLLGCPRDAPEVALQGADDALPLRLPLISGGPAPRGGVPGLEGQIDELAATRTKERWKD